MKKVIALFSAIVFSLCFYAHPVPKGCLFIIGGGKRPESMMKKFVEMAERVRSGKIVVFPMASSSPDEVGQQQAEEFLKLGAKSAESRILTREQALKDDGSSLDDAGGIYFTGGDQVRLTDALVGTPIQKKLLEIYENGVIVGGTSAGAAVMSEIMITGDEKRKVEERHEFETLQAGNIVTVPGLAFIKTAIIDQHFVARKRHNRLISLVAENPRLLGVGIDESTAIVINPDDTFDVIGENAVMIFDAVQASIKITPSQGIGFSNMVVHVLRYGDRFDMARRKILIP